MRALHKGLFLVPLLAAVATAPASAQSWKWDWGVNVGYNWFTNSMGRDLTTLQGDGGEVHFKPGVLFGSQLGYWFGPKFGIRANGRYQSSALRGNNLDTDFVEDVNLWGATGDLMWRFKAPSAELKKWEALPYLALGVGAKWHNPTGDGFTCNDPTDGSSFTCSPFVTGIPGARQGWALGEQNALAGLIGLGADWRMGRSLNLRTEISDMIFKPQIERATIPTTAGARTWTLPTGENIAKTTHELAFQLGLHFLFGVASPPVVAVAPPPAPPPPPPAPEPRREAINVCVVDPAAPGGLRMQTATLVEGRDTVVVSNGSDVAFRTTVPSVQTAAGADWYVQGQPLVMTIGNGKASFTTYGTARVIDANDLAYVGTINGYPVYADRDDVNAYINELNEQTRSGKDLGVILNEQKTLRTSFDAVKVLYVPTASTGCVFQAVQRQEEVRKSGK